MKAIFNDKDQEKKILFEQSKVLYRTLLSIIIGNLIIWIIYLYFLWDEIPHTRLITWLGLMLTVIIGRLVIYISYHRNIQLENVRRYIVYFVIGTGLSGLLWGISGIMLFPEQNLQYQLVILFILLGMGAGAATTLTAYLPAFITYFPLSILPITIMMLMMGDPLHQTLSLMTFAYSIVVLYFGIGNSRDFKQSLQLRFENIKLAEQLREQKEEADRANNAKSKFMAAASHDLRQPLHALTLFTSVLDELIESPKARRVTDQIKSSVYALQNLFNALLDISRLDAGVMKVEKSGFHLQPLFEKLANDFDPQANEKGLQLLWSPCNYSVYSDQNLLEQILRNYISNAIRYTDKGEIRITCEPNDGEIKINVIDSGLGISLDDQTMIFEEFHQLSNPERDRSKGLGLGLAIVQRTAKLLGHAIGVESEAGKGSTFSITVEQVTISKSDKETAPVFENDVSQVGDTLILVVDDEASVREGMQSLLQVWDCDVIAAADQDEAIRLLRQQDRIPDGIISDYRLRENKTGIEVIHAIHAEYDSDIPALIVTGDIATDRLRDVNNSGFQVLHKPVAPLKLRTFLRNIRLRKDQ